LLVSLRSKKIQQYSHLVKLNSIDVSCGDGTFSFITNGGRLSENDDVFKSIVLPEGHRKDNFDSYNYYDDNYRMEIVKEADYNFSVGSDWKENLISKARKLNFYEKLLVHDNNFALPLEQNSFDYVYSNSSYWVDNFEGHINDLVSITKKDGLIALEVKVDNIKKYSSSNYIPFMGEKFHEIIDAGRLSTWKGLRSLSELNEFFSSLKEIEIEDIQPIYGDDMAYIWDIGLRPLFKPLSKMANYLNEDNRLEVKKEWVSTIQDLFEYRIENYKANYSTAIEYLIVLRKI